MLSVEWFMVALNRFHSAVKTEDAYLGGQLYEAYLWSDGPE
jgi:hypothetical protein